MTEKMTYVKALEFAMSQMDRHEVDSAIFEKLEALKAQLEKRAQYKGSGKPTKAQVENAALRAKMLTLMDTTPRTVSEVMALDPDGIGALTNQKVSALLNSAVATGEVVKTVEKRKSFFRLA